MERLDRVFVSVEWESNFPRAFLSAMSSSTSDHSPLKICPEADLHIGKRFDFEAFWPKVDGFLEVMAEAWNSVPPNPNPYKNVDDRLRATSKKLASWGDTFIGNVKFQILVVNEVILRLDVAMERRQLFEAERGLWRLLKRKLLGLASLERSIARQRSRLMWLQEGEACTKFFHMHASHRRRKNFIDELKVDGRMLTAHEDKAEAIDDFYDQLLGSAPDRQFTLDIDELQLPVHDLDHLEAPFSEEEVWEAVKSQALDKAPGPDGFSGLFYVAC